MTVRLKKKNKKNQRKKHKTNFKSLNVLPKQQPNSFKKKKLTGF